MSAPSAIRKGWPTWVRVGVGVGVRVGVGVGVGVRVGLGLGLGVRGGVRVRVRARARARARVRVRIGVRVRVRHLADLDEAVALAVLKGFREHVVDVELHLADEIVLAEVKVVDADLQAHGLVGELVEVVEHRPDHAVIELTHAWLG